jgi:type II secretory pathway pseudopilin PulG
MPRADQKTSSPKTSKVPALARRARAFTYIELVVVLLCLAVAAALVLPEIAAGGTTTLRGAAEEFVSDLEYAQQQSMARGDDCRIVVFDLSKNTYWIAPASTPATAIAHPVDRQPFINRFGQGRFAHLKNVVIDSCDVGGDSRLGFKSLGQLDQSVPARIVLRRGTDRMEVRLDPTTGEATVSWVP